MPGARSGWAVARLWAFLAVAILAALGGCTPRPDPDQARLCRLALVANVDDDAVPPILRQSALPPDANGPGVRLDLGAKAADPFNRARFAECRFSLTSGRLVITGFRTERDALSAQSLLFLQRFWLDSPDSSRSDPEPVETMGAAPSLPRSVAYLAQSIFNALPAMATYAMLSAAYALIYGLIGRINLAFGEMASIGGAASLAGAAFLPQPGGLALLIATLVAAVWAATVHGIVIGRLVFRPLVRATGQQGLVATIGLALALNEYLRLAQGPSPKWITPLRETPVAVARSGNFIVTVTPLALEIAGLFGVAAFGVLVLMARSQFGRNWRALSDDAGAAALCGVNPARVFAQSFALASALAGLAGGTVVLVYGSFGTTLGSIIGLKGLLAAVLGGIGSVRGALLGGVVISLIEAGWSAYFPMEYRDLVLFSLLVVALVIRPGGFFGHREIRPRLV